MATRAILVTGGTRGVGFGICKELFKLRGADNTLRVLLGCRSVEDGQTAASSIRAEAPSVPGDALDVVRIDVTDETSIAEAVSYVGREYGSLYCLVNNAGLGLDLPWNHQPPAISCARDTLAVNLYGLVQTTKAFTDLLLKCQVGPARVVHISSGAACQNLEKMTEARREGLQNCESLKSIMQMSRDFTSSYETFWKDQDKSTEPCHVDGWWPQAYGFSKACVGAYTRVLAKEYPQLLVNCCTPGFVDTAMVREYDGDASLKSLEHGAITPVFLATSDKCTSTGLMFRGVDEGDEPLPLF